MNIYNPSNKQSFHPSYPARISSPKQQRDKKIMSRKVDREVWSIECAIDELELNLSRVVENITFSPEDRGQEAKALTVQKYYQQAKDLMRWIPIARPAPEFIIYAKDLSPKVIEELEARIDDEPHTLNYILREAVGRIFENLDHAYYHLSIARKLQIRMEP